MTTLVEAARRPAGRHGERHRGVAGAACAAALAVALGGCAGPPSAAPLSAGPPSPGVVPSAAPVAPPDSGLWRSDGYGLIYALRGKKLEIYEVTAISCISGDILEQTAAGPDGLLQFGSDGIAEQTLRGEPDARATVHLLGTAADIDLLPIPTLPPNCGREPAEDALTSFDVFWATFAENYNSFGLKKVDWVAARDRFRPGITKATQGRKLFETLQAMIQPLGDIHTEIDADDDGDFSGLRPGTRELPPEATNPAVDKHLRSLGASPILVFAGGAIAYTDLPDGRGYLRINTFDEYNKNDDSFQASSAELARALDAVFTPARVGAWKALVVDVRNNSGGDDALALQVTGRLTDQPYLAYTKAARNDPADQNRYGRAQQVSVTPAAGARFLGPVHLLISDMTVSAGETFVLAMMGRNPAPTRIGTTTQGVFADTLDRELPNGWTVVLGNERYIGQDGRDYEGTGIPPTREIPVFPPGELAAGQDSALDAAR